MAKATMIERDVEVNLTMSGNEAAFLKWLLGRCNGSASSPSPRLYRALEAVIDFDQANQRWDPQGRVEWVIDTHATEWDQVDGSKSNVL